MAKIHWLVYIAVGLFVSVLSYKINYNNLYLFFYVGWIFVLIGIIKMLFGFGKNKDVKNLQQKMQHKNLTQPQHSMQHHQKHHYKRCHRCGNVMRLNDRFCSKCGLRL